VEPKQTVMITTEAVEEETLSNMPEGTAGLGVTVTMCSGILGEDLPWERESH